MSFVSSHCGSDADREPRGFVRWPARSRQSIDPCATPAKPVRASRWALHLDRLRLVPSQCLRSWKDIYARTRYQCGHGFQVVLNYFDGNTQLFTPVYYGDLPLCGFGTFSPVVIAVPGFHSRYDLLSKEHAFCSPECRPGIRVMKRLIFSSSATPSSSSSSNRLSISSERQDLNNAILFHHHHHRSHRHALPVHRHRRRHVLRVVWPH